MDRVAMAEDDHVERAAVLEEYLTLARAHDGETWLPGPAPAPAPPLLPHDIWILSKPASSTATWAATPRPWTG